MFFISIVFSNRGSNMLKFFSLNYLLHLHLPTSTYFYLLLPQSTSIYLLLSTSTYFYLHLNYFFLHLPQFHHLLHLPQCPHLPNLLLLILLLLFKSVPTCTYLYWCTYFLKMCLSVPTSTVVPSFIKNVPNCTYFY